MEYQRCALDPHDPAAALAVTVGAAEPRCVRALVVVPAYNEDAEAIATFQILMERNKKANTDFFEDDAEYYLAMSYLNNHELQKAMPIFEKIQSDPDHKYNGDVSEWFRQNDFVVKNVSHSSSISR